MSFGFCIAELFLILFCSCFSLWFHKVARNKTQKLQFFLLFLLVSSRWENKQLYILDLKKFLILIYTIDFNLVSFSLFYPAGFFTIAVWFFNGPLFLILFCWWFPIGFAGLLGAHPSSFYFLYYSFWFLAGERISNIYTWTMKFLLLPMLWCWLMFVLIPSLWRVSLCKANSSFIIF